MKQITLKTIQNYNTCHIVIGSNLFTNAGRYLSSVLPQGKLCLITDDTVDRLYADAVSSGLQKSGYAVHKFVFPHGEGSKTMQTYGDILNFLASQGFTRSDSIAALGGGVVGDISGFAAASYLRGISFVQLPTTLLAAVDSSVGGKTGVNLSAGKNLAGCFWQPSLVLCDCHSLESLPREILLDGAAEAIKYGILADPALFTLLKKDQRLTQMQEIIARCIQIKCDFVEQDERDSGRRQMLNLGHTLGHAIETCSGYTVSHGHAVAAGILAAAKACRFRGLCSQNFIDLLEDIFRSYGFPLSYPYTAEELMNAALHDKKKKGDTITLVLPLAIGNCKLEKIPVKDLKAFIQQGLL